MTLGPSLGAFLGTAFLAFFCLYFMLNLSKDKVTKRSADGVVEVVEENVKHKFLQVILIVGIVVALIINGVSVTDMSSRQCQYLVNSSTTSGSTTSYTYSYDCSVDENAAAISYNRLLYQWFLPAIGFYMFFYVLVTMVKGARESKEDSERRRYKR